MSDQQELPHGNLSRVVLDYGKQGPLSDPATNKLIAEIKNADVVKGVDSANGKPAGLFYGVAKLRRVVRRGKPLKLRVLNVPLDRATDDAEALFVLVEYIKGACCYDGIAC